MVEHTLTAMARGGIYDQVGGGFARYSVDARWLVPHFEKMLYDNALLLRAYLHWWRSTGDPLARRIVEQGLDGGEEVVTGGHGGLSDGTGTAARFSFPENAVADGAYLYVSDTGNSVIRRIDTGSAGDQRGRLRRRHRVADAPDLPP